MRRLLAFLILTGVVLFSFSRAMLQIEKIYQREAKYPPLWAQLLASAGRGNFGTGKYGGVPNSLNLSLLQPGDILLGGNSGGSYGCFTHAGLYIGNNKVVDMYISTGVYITEAETYHQYDWAAILRVKAEPSQKKAVVSYVSKEVGSPFFILTPKAENGLWYCTKLIWYAYLQQGVDLDFFKSYWVIPDAFWYSTNTQVIAYSRAR
ncbi:MAG: YiiX/YebB-like N1pC/P60 family cysteine hydrolase [Bacillota bacterium]|nr:YiiX/YebB-like N1pC/P60 family cysteine hydrolase [Bacillota bacterium]